MLAMININKDILSDVAHGFNLPSKPEVLQQLQDELNKPEPELGAVASIISSDIATAAAVLKIINSPFYGLSRTVTDVKQAVMFLGLVNITALVTGYLLKNAFDQSSCSIQLNRFWDEANDIANVTCIIARRLSTPIPVENMHLLGLFHDAGIPAMAIRYQNYNQAYNPQSSSAPPQLIDRENKEYSTNHAIVGYYLASSWNLPKSICTLILQHHSLDYLEFEKDDLMRRCYATLKLAENLVYKNKMFSNEPSWHHIAQDVLDCLKLDEDDFHDLTEDVEDYLIHAH